MKCHDDFSNLAIFVGSNKQFDHPVREIEKRNFGRKFIRVIIWIAAALYYRSIRYIRSKKLTMF